MCCQVCLCATARLGWLFMTRVRTIDKVESWLEGRGCALMWEGGVRQGRGRVKRVAEALERPRTVANGEHGMKHSVFKCWSLTNFVFNI